MSSSVKAVAAKTRDSDSVLVKINTAIPILSLLILAGAAGKLVTDVSHIRELMEIRNQYEDARYKGLEGRVNRVEAFIGMPGMDGTPRR